MKKAIFLLPLLLAACVSKKTVQEMGNMRAGLASMKGPPSRSQKLSIATEKKSVEFCDDEKPRAAVFRKALIAGGFNETGYFDEALAKFQEAATCDAVADAEFIGESKSITSAKDLATAGRKCVTLTGYPVKYISR